MEAPLCLLRSLAKGKKLLLGKEEKEVLVEENLVGAVQRRRRSVADTPTPCPRALCRGRSLALSPPGGASRLCPDLAGHPATGSGISSTPSPSPFPCLVRVPLPLAFPSRVSSSRGSRTAQHADSTDSKPSELRGFVLLSTHPTSLQSLVTHQ